MGSNVTITLSYEGGGYGLTDYSALVTPVAESNRVGIIGSNLNSIDAIGNQKLVLNGQDPERQEGVFFERGTKTWGHYQEDENFIRHMLGKEKPKIDVKDARRAQEIAEAAIRSQKEVMTVRVV